jgi:hypothetical protein
MLSNHLARFLRDEDGGYTIWGLTWFMLYVGIGGLAVDTTDAYRTQTMLQATADAAALAGIMSPLNDESEVDTWALAYAGFNMQPGVHGNVVTAADVDIGTWNFTTRTFTLGGTDPNAVRAIARRDSTNANPLATNFLRIIGLQSWDVNTVALAAIGIDECFNHGIISGGTLDVKPHTNFIDNICLIGVEAFLFRKNDTTFEDGVYIGAGCGEEERKCIGPGNQVYDNEDFADAFDMDFVTSEGGNYDDPTLPLNAMNVDLYINAVLDLGNPDDGNPFTDFDAFEATYSAGLIDYSGYAYLSPGYDPITGNGGVPDYYTGAALPAAPVPYTIYNLDSCPQNGYVLPEGDYANVAVIANCPISFVTDGAYNISNSLIASTYSSEGRAAISGSANVNLGSGGCTNGNEMYSLGDIHLASNGDFANLRILADGDVHFAASSDSANGTNIQATGDVFLASGANNEADGSTYGYCGDGTKGAQVLTAALVH